MIPIGTRIRLPLPVPFYTPLEYVAIKHESGEILIELLEALSVVTRFGNVTLPKGFVSDGASIPKLARAIVGSPFEFEYLAAAVIHDALYRKGYYDEITRAQADLIFRDLLWDTKVSFWKIPPFYAAVRAGGWCSYKKRDTI
jgi:hypothetical protein